MNWAKAEASQTVCRCSGSCWAGYRAEQGPAWSQRKGEGTAQHGCKLSETSAGRNVGTVKSRQGARKSKGRAGGTLAWEEHVQKRHM